METIRENIKNYLESVSIEQFMSEWNEIVSTSSISPLLVDYFNQISLYSQCCEEDPPLGNYSFLEENTTFTAPLQEPILF